MFTFHVEHDVTISALGSLYAVSPCILYSTVTVALCIALDKKGYELYIFLISSQKHVLGTH